MTLGEKIKEARIEHHMTQKDVVGDYITRNMLSKIENGSATPSIKTLEYLAGRLGLPSSYFLSDLDGDADEPFGIDGARSAYLAGNYEAALHALDALDFSRMSHGAEEALLRTLCCTALARQAVLSGDDAASRAWAREALKHNSEGVYFDAMAEAECCQILMLWSIRSGGEFEEYEQRYNAALARGEFMQRQPLVRALYNCAELGAAAAGASLSDLSELTDAWSRAVCGYIRGRAALDAGDVTGAETLLSAAEGDADSSGDKMLRSDVYAALERVHREREDFRMAYEYASKRLGL